VFVTILQRFGYLSVLLIASLLMRGEAVAQPDTTTTAGLIAASIAPAAVIGIALEQNYFDFWRNSDKVPFYFSNDPPYAMHADKLGHAMYSYVCADVVKLCYVEAGVNRKTAAWLGFGSSVLAQTMVEIGDGFHGHEPYYGFSPGDEAGDILGAGFSLMKEYVPYLNRFDYKVGVWPSQAYHQGAFRGLLDDDESQFFWMSMDIHDYLPTPYPAWLNLAIGYGVENLTSSAFLPDRSGLTPKSLVYLGFDLNLRNIPIEGKAWKIIAEILSHYRVPFPALQIAPIVKWHWIKP
jgi:hypothetical protein